MELFYGGGGRSNPDFRFKVRIRQTEPNIDEMMKWCDDYPTGDHGYFKRYHIDWRDGKDNIWKTDYVTFQFEWEEPAIMFALKFGAA